MLTMMCDKNAPGAREIKYAGADYPIYVRDSYEGCVLNTRERNGYDDSDFYADVWDEEAGCVRSIEYATTRAWTYPNHAVVDATDEVRAKANAWSKAKDDEWKARGDDIEVKCPDKGRRVVILKAGGRRKDLKGKEGEVFWVGVDNFGRNRWSEYKSHRVGVKLDDGSKEFFPADAVKVVGADKDGEAALMSLGAYRKVAGYSTSLGRRY